MLGDHWTIEVCRGSSNLSPIEQKWRVELSVRHFFARIEKEIDIRENGLGRDNRSLEGKSQYAVEYQRLLVFRDRLAAMPLSQRRVKIAQTECPYSLNDPIFQGKFNWHKCEVCGRTNAPDDTNVVSFQSTTGMQEYGKCRQCPCGETFAYLIEGQER